MPVSFSGGSALPAVGTAAYSAAQTGTGQGSFNPTTGVLSSNAASTPLYSPPQAGGSTATTPVVTAKSAQDDYNAKYASYKQITDQINAQTAQKATQAQIDASTKAQNDLQASENNLKQQGIDIQKAQAQAQMAEAQAKKDAVAAATSSTTDTGTTSVTSTGTPTGTTGTTTPAGTAGTTDTSGNQGDTANQGISTATSQYQSGIQSIQGAKDTLAAQMTSSLQSLLAGTIPLSGPQQALITSLQSQLQTNEALQTTANTSYTGQIAESSFRSGGEYTPAQMAGQIQNAISVGVTKIQALDNSAASTIASMEQSFQKQDFDIINQQYSVLTKQLDDKAAAIKDTYDTTVAAIKDQRDYQLKITDSINSVALEAAKNGADAKTIAAIKGQTTEAGAIAAAGSSLATGQWDIEKTTDAFGNDVLTAVNKNNPQERYNLSGGNAGTVLSSTPSNPGDPTNPQTGLSFSQYGLLANTDFNPKSQTDQLAQSYLDKYLKTGVVPSASTMGRGLKPSAFATVDSRARDLYFKATGTALPNPEVIKGYQTILQTNNTLANNLKIQEQTVKANVDLSLENIKANGLDSSGFKPLTSLINTVSDMFNDPHVGQLIAQNATIQNELGSLLAVKNASGTTVYDKLTSAGIITSSDSPEQVQTKVNALLSEAANFAASLNSANADIYKQIDPLMQDPNNPLRSAETRTSTEKVTDYYANNPTLRSGMDKAQSDFKAQNGRDMTPDELLQAFPEANLSVTSVKNQ